MRGALERDGGDLTGLSWPLGGYAPGSYFGTCKVCGDRVFNIDKRAYECLKCAIIGSLRPIEKPKVLLDAVGELALAIKPHNMDGPQRRKIADAIGSLVEHIIAYKPELTQWPT